VIKLPENISYLNVHLKIEGSKSMSKIENNRLEQFRRERSEDDDKIFDLDHLGIKRFFNLDNNTYKDGALPGKTKELLGLVASTVMRCNDCIDYHLEECAKAGFTKDEIVDALNVAMMVGGSIVIPHLRHAVNTLEILEDEGTLEV
jgi:AhpD family alkylhydroperoxidase